MNDEYETMADMLVDLQIDGDEETLELLGYDADGVML